MTTLKVRMKIGKNHFEADGPTEAVQAQADTFVRLVSAREQVEGKSSTKHESKTPGKPETTAPPASPAPLDLNRILRFDGRIVICTVPVQPLDSAVLLLLLGQQRLRGNNAVTGSEIMNGLRDSGHVVERADHVLKRHASAGNVVVTGKHRLRRYRLSTDGVVAAQRIATTVIASQSATVA